MINLVLTPKLLPKVIHLQYGQLFLTLLKYLHQLKFLKLLSEHLLHYLYYLVPKLSYDLYNSFICIISSVIIMSFIKSSSHKLRWLWRYISVICLMNNYLLGFVLGFTPLLACSWSTGTHFNLFINIYKI